MRERQFIKKKEKKTTEEKAQLKKVEMATKKVKNERYSLFGLNKQL